MGRLAVLLPILLLAASLATAGGAAPAQETKLLGTVGPEFTITLQDAQGNRVTQLDPGPYEAEIRDRSDFHTFHLSGPGVDERTEVEFTGEVTWRVTLRNGSYTFLCDVHPSAMRGVVSVGTPPPSSPPAPPPPPSGGAITAKTKLVLTSGPSRSITLKTTSGAAVRTMKPGTYTVTVRDRSRMHNARIVAPGFNRATTVAFVGQQTWRVRLTRAGTLRFLCDQHASQMKGSARIVR